MQDFLRLSVCLPESAHRLPIPWLDELSVDKVKGCSANHFVSCPGFWCVEFRIHIRVTKPDNLSFEFCCQVARIRLVEQMAGCLLISASDWLAKSVPRAQASFLSIWLIFCRYTKCCNYLWSMAAVRTVELKAKPQAKWLAVNVAMWTDRVGLMKGPYLHRS